MANRTRGQELGRAKSIFERASMWISKFNFVMLLYLTLHTKPALINLLPIAIPLFLIWVWFDLKYIYPNELRFNYLEMNPVIKDMLKQFQRIEEKLDAIEKKGAGRGG
jgi:hypothetical protein